MKYVVSYGQSIPFTLRDVSDSFPGKKSHKALVHLIILTMQALIVGMLVQLDTLVSFWYMNVVTSLSTLKFTICSSFPNQKFVITK